MITSGAGMGMMPPGAGMMPPGVGMGQPGFPGAPGFQPGYGPM